MVENNRGLFINCKVLKWWHCVLGTRGRDSTVTEPRMDKAYGTWSWITFVSTTSSLQRIQSRFFCRWQLKCVVFPWLVLLWSNSQMFNNLIPVVVSILLNDILYFHLTSTGQKKFLVPISYLTLRMLFRRVQPSISCNGFSNISNVWGQKVPCLTKFTVNILRSCFLLSLSSPKNGRWDVPSQGITNAKRITGWRNAAFANLTGFVRPS